MKEAVGALCRRLLPNDVARNQVVKRSGMQMKLKEGGRDEEGGKSSRKNATVEGQVREGEKARDKVRVMRRRW